MLILAVIVNLDLKTKVTLDEEKITLQNWTGSVTLGWPEIDDIHCSPRLISIASTRRGERIKIFKGEYGFSLEPFDALQEEVTRHAAHRLEQVWEQLKFPLAYTYPGGLWGLMLVYLIPICLVLTFFILFAIRIEGLWFEKFLFLVVGILVLIPLFIRDYRRTHKKLILEPEGVREANGKEKFIPWQAITRIIVREPLSIGYGSIIVESRAKQSIRIPRSLMYCGQVNYFLKKRTQITETYSHEY